MSKTIQILCLAILLPLLAACATSGKPVNKDNSPQGDAVISSKALAMGAAQCPSVGIVEDLRSMTLFTDNAHPAPEEVIGYGKIDDFDGGCVYEAGGVAMDIDLMFSARIGAKAKTGRGDPSIAFPYFIAISDDQGNILNKEVFATAIRFNEGLESAHQVEHLKPRIPLNNPALGPKYQVLVGFQLNREQLQFNRGGTQ